MKKENHQEEGLSNPGSASKLSNTYDPSGKDGVSRREFLEFASAGVIAGTLQAAFPPADARAEVKNGIPYRELGRTGEKVSLVGLGGYHLGKQADPNESVAIIRKALDEGINFLDNCWDYNGGESEIRMGQALRDGYRDKAFLMTKIDGRTNRAPPHKSTSLSGAFRLNTLTCFNSTRSFAIRIQIESLLREALSKRLSQRRETARSASLDLPGTRVLRFISKCSLPLRYTISLSIRCRCR
jgi:Aldo/keto reductase family